MEETLSDKSFIVNKRTGTRHYREDDLKVFIEILKSELCVCNISKNKCVWCYKINKLAGERLTSPSYSTATKEEQDEK